ncbi:TnsD family Tn7-like transposition protein [Pseudomonas moorei]|uniref:TniQ protein n=1 Tax=Pseudomonas moorei TaxID=395599 RepID=A0A1H1IJK4_9PSED|nr:TnsD family Tn7-like transposition protein [Pseudomonas moorei]KAB0509265.1 hypothetical protein F7R06_05130 [Pseudomonas moorei]SDR37862.1 TniQ protein [Pseudomonas moorei]
MNLASAGYLDQQLNVTLRWLEDETFFSLCSRHHFFNGQLASAMTSMRLTNPSPLKIKHDFPYNLDTLDEQLLSAWGNPETIISKHTILPMFFPFQSDSNINAAILALHSSKLGSIKYCLGLITSRFGAEHPLKACRACIKADAAAYGVSYWHLTHQYPGVIVCPVHRKMLMESHHNRRWSARFSWVLPSQDSLTDHLETVFESRTQDLLVQLATAVIELAALGLHRRFDLQLVKTVYRNALGRFCSSGQNLKSIASSLSHLTSLLQPYHPLTCLPTTAEGAASYIEQLTRSPRGHCHPLKHLIMIIWLFGDMDSFVEAYDHQEAKEGQAVLTIGGRDRISPGTERIPEKSLAQKSIRRPKVLKPRLRIQILERLAAGKPKTQVCSEFEISISTVNRLLREEPLVERSWAEIQRKSALIQHRKNWMATVKETTHPSAKTVRARTPELYAWLYRNDKAWLLSQTTKLPSGRIGNNSRIDWEARDVDLEIFIRKSLIEKFGSDKNLRLDNFEIFSLAPTLSSCLENRSRYPRTRALISLIKKNS